MAKRYLSISETAERLAVSRKTLYAMLERGEIVPDLIINIGKQRRCFFLDYKIEELATSRNVSDPKLAILLIERQTV